MIFKDFLWFVFKENFVVNFFYIYFFRYFYYFASKANSSSNTILSKEMLINECRSKPLFSLSGYTSGTTNKPMIVYRSVFSILHEEYTYKLYLRNCGVPINPRIAVIRGDKIKSGRDNSPPFWLKMPFTRRLIFSSFHLSSSNAKYYLQKLDDEKPEIIFAYPSSVTFLARIALEMRWKPTWKFYGVFTSSETFTIEDQNLCSLVFGKVFDHYGQAERVAVLQQCSFHNYHVRDDYSRVEFVEDSHGFKIVGSNYYNTAMPLVRYDTGDYVIGLKENEFCSCGNTSRFVSKILGRDDDYIVLKDGRHIGRMDVVFKSIVNLAECQLVQLDFDFIEVRYTPISLQENEKLLIEMKSALIERLGDDIEFHFLLTKQIERSDSGKFKSVVRCFIK